MVCIYHILFNHSSVEGYLGGAVKVKYLSKSLLSVLLGLYPGVELLCQMVILCLVLEELLIRHFYYCKVWGVRYIWKYVKSGNHVVQLPHFIRKETKVQRHIDVR